jgi:hypothetical protein
VHSKPASRTCGIPPRQSRLLIIGIDCRLEIPEQWPGRWAVPVFSRGYPGGGARGVAGSAGQFQASGARLHPSSGESWPALSCSHSSSVPTRTAIAPAAGPPWGD